MAGLLRSAEGGNQDSSGVCRGVNGGEWVLRAVRRGVRLAALT